MRPLELYIHITFCVKKCRYCDFLSAPATPEARQEYVMGLCQKIRSYYDLAGMYHVSSIFIGGFKCTFTLTEETLKLLMLLKLM